MSASALIALFRRAPRRAAGGLIGAVILVGGLLDTWNNARSLITPVRTFVITAIVLAAAVCLWFFRRNARYAIMPKTAFTLAGVVVVAWMPRIADVFSGDRPQRPPSVMHRRVSQFVPDVRPRVYMLMVDVSASLKDTDVRQAVANYVGNTNNKVRIGLGIFAQRFTPLMRPSVLPASAYTRALEHLPVANCTHIYESMLDARGYLSGYDREKRRLVLFTDGNEFPCTDERPHDWAFERDFPGYELDIVMLGRANIGEMKRLFPRAHFVRLSEEKTVVR